MMRRHATLRTTFDSVDGRPVQVVAPRVELPLATIDLRALDGPSRESEARSLAIQEARQPFDLARGPLTRVRVLVLGDDDHAILLTMHHIIGDGWSLGVAARELAVLYDAFSRGDPSPLDLLPIQYTDYSLWQHRLLAGDTLQRLAGYWSRQLAGATPLELPTDRPRPPIRTNRGAVHPFAIAAELAGSIHALCRSQGVTPYMVLLSTLQALLHRYSGQDDIVVGSPIANRNRSEVEGLIGYFVNMLALRTDLSGDPSFVDLVHRVREVALAAYEHQDLPLEKVIEVLHLPRDPSRTPLFQVMFVLQNNQAPEPHTPRADPRAAGPRRGDRHGQVRPDPGDRRVGRGLLRRDRVQHRPVRSRDHRSDDGSLPGHAGGHPRRSKVPPLRLADDRRGRAAADPRQWDRAQDRSPGRTLHPPPVRGPGRTNP